MNPQLEDAVYYLRQPPLSSLDLYSRSLVPDPCVFAAAVMPRIVINSSIQISNSGCLWLLNFIVDSFICPYVCLAGWFSNFLTLVCICNFYDQKTDFVCLFIHIFIFIGHNRDCQGGKRLYESPFWLNHRVANWAEYEAKAGLKVHTCPFPVLFLTFFFYWVLYYFSSSPHSTFLRITWQKINHLPLIIIKILVLFILLGVSISRIWKFCRMIFTGPHPFLICHSVN